MTEAFIQLPADGSGKRLHTNPVIQLTFDGGLVAFSAGDIVTGQTSGVQAIVIAQTAGNTSAGTLLLRPLDASDLFFTDNEVLNVSGTPYANANGVGQALHSQIFTIGSAEDPTRRLKVDDQGAAYVRFTDGPQLLDSMGHTVMTQRTPIGTYNFRYDEQGDVVTTSSLGGGSVSYNFDDRSMLLSVDNMSGSVARLVSKKYHRVFAGMGLELVGTTVANHSGLPGNVRRVGLFDDSNGIFFMASGSFVGLVLRSSATGTPVETQIPASQFDNVLLSNGPIDLTKVNQFFIDINPAGRIRYGAFDADGTRRILHTISSLNSTANIIAGSFELPLRAELINQAATAGTTELRVFDAYVYSQTELNDEQLITIRSHADASLTQITGSNHHVITVRPKTIFKSQINRSVGLLDELHTALPNNSNSILRAKIIKNALLTSSSWSQVQNGNSAFEQTTLSGTYIPNTGNTIFSSYINETTTKDLSKHVKYLNEFISLDWDGSQNDSYTLIYDLISGSTIDVYTTLDLREVQ